MKYCSKCGAELHGQFCSECGHNNKTEGQGNKVTEWLHGVWEKCSPPLLGIWDKVSPVFKRYTKQIVIGGCALVVAIVTLIITLSITSNIFRAGKVAKIELGADEATVERILGAPTEKEYGRWYWYEDNVQEKVDEAEAMLEAAFESEDEDRIDKATEKYDEMYEEIYDMTYRFIVVEFDGDGLVTDVFLDTAHYFEEDDYSDGGKEVKRTECDSESVTGIAIVDDTGKTVELRTDSSIRIGYSVTYEDGSYYRGEAFPDVTVAEGDSRVNLVWEDYVSGKELKKSIAPRWI